MMNTHPPSVIRILSSWWKNVSFRCLFIYIHSNNYRAFYSLKTVSNSFTPVRTMEDITLELQSSSCLWKPCNCKFSWTYLHKLWFCCCSPLKLAGPEATSDRQLIDVRGKRAAHLPVSLYRTSLVKRAETRLSEIRHQSALNAGQRLISARQEGEASLAGNRPSL